MSDVVVRVGGRQTKVNRAFRTDNESEFYLREHVDVQRVDKHGSVVATLERVKPGAWVYGMIELLHDHTHSMCKQRLDCLPVFYVLEILQKRATPQRLDNGSDDVDVLVLPCKLASEVTSGRLRSRERLNTTDLLLGDRPLYMPADAIVTTMRAVVGPGEATPGFDGPRRVSHYVTNVDEDFQPEGDRCDIKPLYTHAALLQAPYEHAADYLELQHVPVPPQPPQPAAGQPLLVSRTPSYRVPKPKRPFDQSSDADTSARARTSLPSPTTKRPRGRPRKTVSLSDSVLDTNKNDEQAQAVRALHELAEAVEIPRASVASAAARAPPPVSPKDAVSPYVSSPGVPSAPQPQPRPDDVIDVVLTDLSPTEQATVLASVRSLRAIAASYPVDLSQSTWQQYKPQLTACVVELMRTRTCSEVAFTRSARLCAELAAFCKAHLGGEFGAFVDETVRANRGLAAQFLSRLPESQLPVAHILFLRPLVYDQLRQLTQTWGFDPIDDDIVADALKLKQQAHSVSQKDRAI
jgi:hypothetical protein